jgi:urea transporter
MNSASYSIKTILRGVSQVMLQNNVLTGFLFLVGIFYNSWLMGLGAILGNVVGTVSAKLLHYPQKDIADGTYGANSTLVGIAVWFFLKCNIASTVAIIIGAFLSSIILHEMKKRIPAYTAPFVVAAWVVIYGVLMLHLGTLVSSASSVSSFHFIPAITTGIGQVMFQNNIVTGLIFLLAILVSSRTAAAYALFGTLLGGSLALLFAFPLASINIGIFGYNGVLCGIALGERKYSAVLYAGLAVALSVLLCAAFDTMNVLALTAPFVLATWIVLSIGRLRSVRNSVH